MSAAFQSPSIFAGYRRKGLKFILNQLPEDKGLEKALRGKWGEKNAESKVSWAGPVFLFGDFNFRLNSRTFVQVSIFFLRTNHVFVFSGKKSGFFVPRAVT